MKQVKFHLISLTSIAMSLIFFSCQDDLSENSRSNRQDVTSSTLKDDNLSLKIEFGKAFAKITAESQEVRDLIKNEALKKFDHDYDVLYQFVKDKKLSNGITLEGLILKHVKPETLLLIEKRLPTLTIFIPELPENSFSAEIWNTSEDIPLVAIRAKYENNVRFYDSNGSESILKGNQIPMHPVLVIKENERVLVNNSANSSKSVSLKSSSNIQFNFLDNVFDNMNSNINTQLKATNSQDFVGGPYEAVITFERSGTYTAKVPEHLWKVLDAYDIYKNIDGWYRDYVYYGLTPTTTAGPFKYNFKEHIVAFEMVGDPNLNLAKISDQSSEPKRTNSTFGPAWTDGEFEFKVKVYLGNKNGFGSELITYFRAKPEDIFNLQRKRGDGRYEEGVSSNRKYYLSLPLFEWNLENYSANIKIGIEEADATETIKQTTTSSSEFATNFGFDINWGETVKKGLKFGSSNKEVRTTSYEVSTTHGNDDLGEAIINFGDPIITSREIIAIPNTMNPSTREVEGSLNFNQKYSTGWYRLYIAPQKTN